MENKRINILTTFFSLFLFGLGLLVINVLRKNEKQNVQTFETSKLEQTFEDKIYENLIVNDTRGIDPRYLLAIAILETGHGEGYVYQNTKNLFSVKADNVYPGQVFIARSRYRVYDNFSDSIEDMVRLLTTRSRYKTAYRWALLDERKKFFQALQDAEYSEDKHYAQKLERNFQTFERKEVSKRFSQYKIVACSINNDSACKASNSRHNMGLNGSRPNGTS